MALPTIIIDGLSGKAIRSQVNDTATSKQIKGFFLPKCLLMKPLMNAAGIPEKWYMESVTIKDENIQEREFSLKL
jgi:hypothetical protein